MRVTTRAYAAEAEQMPNDLALLGMDTVQTPIAERRAVWGEMATAFPTATIDSLVEGEVTLDGLAPVLESILAGKVRGRMLVRPGG